MKVTGGMSLMAFCCLAPLFAQTASRQSSEELQAGIVVESVAANSAAQKMGFAPGDIILAWKQGEHHAPLTSPLDLLDVEVEELPLGTVTVDGISGSVAKTWSWTESKTPNVREGAWGLTTRPNIGGSLLAVHQTSLAAAKGNGSAAASEHWQAAAREAENRHLPVWLVGWFWLRSAESLGAGRDAKGADRACRQAVDIANGDGNAAYKFLRACGDLMLQQHAEEQAKTYYQQALTECQKVNANSLACASLLTILGRMAYTSDDYPRGESLVLQALKIQEQLAPESMVYAGSLNRIGVLLQSTGELDESAEYLLRAVAAREKLIPESVPLAQTLQNLADTFILRGDLDKAEGYHLRALKLFEALQPDSNALAGCLVDMSSGARDRGDLGKAEEYLRRALAIQMRLQPRGPGTAASLNNLALILQARGQSAAAEKMFSRSLAIKRESSPTPLNIAITIGNLALLFQERGDLAKAEEYLLQNLVIREKFTPKSPDTATVYSQLGDVALSRGNVTQAEKHYHKALALLEAAAPGGYGISDVLESLGDIAWKKDDLAGAGSYYLRALRVRERLSQSSVQYAETLMALGRLAQRQRQLEAAEHHFHQALEALERQTAMLGGSADVRTGFRARRESYYRDYIDLLLMQQKPVQAFEVLELSRARTLLETLANAHVDIHKGADPELLTKERSLQADIKGKSERLVHLLTEQKSDEPLKVVEREISALSSEYQDVEAQIRSRSPAYAALTQPQPLSANETQEQLLDPQTLLLEYSLGEERSHVFVVSSNSLQVFTLPKRAVIEAASRSVYELLTARNRRADEKSIERVARIARADAQYANSAARLSRMVLGPIAGKLAGKRLLIVSDGALHYVSFAVLPTRGLGNTTVPLVARHEIVNLPSASVLAVLRREHMGRRPAAKTVAVLADPVFDRGDSRVKPVDAQAREVERNVRASQEGDAGQEFAGGEESLALSALTRSAADAGWKRTRHGEVYLPRLQSTRKEAEAIVAATPAGQSFAALDFKANRSTATSQELANYRIVHFATHALLNSKHPELSGLVLSLVDEHGRPQSGFLGLEDIYNLNLPAELVVLSACETALGKDIEGEGMVGLTRGFMYAGASRVMATLWSIDDRATADQMKYFYRAMVSDGMRPAAALRAAQLKMRKDPRWSSPYFWAAFQIQGEWK